MPRPVLRSDSRTGGRAGAGKCAETGSRTGVRTGVGNRFLDRWSARCREPVPENVMLVVVLVCIDLPNFSRNQLDTVDAVPVASYSSRRRFKSASAAASQEVPLPVFTSSASFFWLPLSSPQGGPHEPASSGSLSFVILISRVAGYATRRYRKP